MKGIQFSELEADALAEAFNLSLGEAAATFSTMVHEEIELSVPTVEVVSHSDFIKLVESMQNKGPNLRLASISQEFESDAGFDTRTFLLFPEQGSLEIVRRMLGDDTPIEQITELEQDALAEIGNVIINSCMSSLANLLGARLEGSLPAVEASSSKDLLADRAPDAVMLVARISMTMSAYDISGLVLFVMDVPSITNFMTQVRRVFRFEA
jgi:chemotaxis protein CheC